jgi:hypothetical protein
MLPRQLEEAVAYEIISDDEARRLHELVKDQPAGVDITIPPELQDACDRLLLWNLPAASQRLQ